MKRYSVTVNKDGFKTRYSAIARRSIDVVSDALNIFGVCGVTVIPMELVK